MAGPPHEDDVQRAEAITRGGHVSAEGLAKLAGSLREQHVVAPIAPMLAAVARRALGARNWDYEEQLELAKTLRDHQQFRHARRLLRALRERGDARYDEEVLLQQLAVCTYKDMELPAMRRLDGALRILTEGRQLEDVESAETLGIAGAIYKRIWGLSAKQSDLERARCCYERGFKRVNDSERWYAGINAAFVADQLAKLATTEEALGYGTRGRASTLADRATEIRLKIVAEHPRNGEEWTAETLGEAYFGLKLFRPAHLHLTRAGKVVKHLWKRETSAMQLAALARLRDIDDDDAKAALEALVHDRDGAVRRAGTGKVGLALSGGGFRASLFHLGVLARLAECDALRRVEVLSCVSGGSIVGAFYYLELRELLQDNPDPEIEAVDYVRLVEDVTRKFFGCVERNLRGKLFTNPFDDLRMATPWYSRTHRTAALLDELFYSTLAPKGAPPLRMTDLLIRPKGEPEGFSLRYENWLRQARVPMLVLNATTLNTGHSWQFTPSWMGEPPAGGDEPIDATQRLRRIYYADGQDAPKLATAVGASACVPMLFEPVKLERLYDGLDVELVDGGIHDNQGIASLVEQDCAVLLVSDASGLLGDKEVPRRNVVSVVWRTQSVLMSRVRGAQISELVRRQRSGALRGLMMVHLKKGLSPPPRDPIHCAERYDPDDDPFVTARRPDYGIDVHVQRALSELRTDLDRFSAHEAHSLMAAGYAMTRHELADAMDDVFPQVDALVDAARWPFATTLAALGKPRVAHGLQPGMLKVVRRARAWRARRSAG